MGERRSLSDGIKPQANTPTVDPDIERQFVHGTKTVSTPPAPITRVPISTRIRAEYADALKRASLQRQLDKVEPSTLQDILEQAIEPWLKANGYIR
jgi:hypothetical protein